MFLPYCLSSGVSSVTLFAGIEVTKTVLKSSFSLPYPSSAPLGESARFVTFPVYPLKASAPPSPGSGPQSRQGLGFPSWVEKGFCLEE